jgi:hypothetical protein
LGATLASAEKSVRYAEYSNDWGTQLIASTTHANSLHQAGRSVEADTQFSDAEKLQAKEQPEHPLLYALQGFQYCELLLAHAERSAWYVHLNGCAKKNHAATLNDVEKRSRQTLHWMQIDPNAPLLTIAIEHLTLCRVMLYATALKDASLSPTSSTSDAGEHTTGEINQAVDGLRGADVKNLLPCALLTRAWLRCLQGQRTGPDSAKIDLDDAWEIAERGPMPLFLADIHLHRSRLYFREQDYPWSQHTDGSPRGPQDDLAEARRLIEKHGYWRRKEELEDAEAALAHWTTLENTPALAT